MIESREEFTCVVLVLIEYLYAAHVLDISKAMEITYKTQHYTTQTALCTEQSFDHVLNSLIKYTWRVFSSEGP